MVISYTILSILHVFFHITLTKPLWRNNYHYFHFTDEKAETKKCRQLGFRIGPISWRKYNNLLSLPSHVFDEIKAKWNKTKRRECTSAKNTPYFRKTNIGVVIGWFGIERDCSTKTSLKFSMGELWHTNAINEIIK